MSADQPHARPEPVIEVDLGWLRGWWRQHRTEALTRTTWLLAAILTAIPTFSLGDELLAFTGERFFGVGDLPAVVAPDERTTVLDAEGNVIGHVTGAENRRSLALDEVPPVLRKAIIATEDHRFWRHEGVDVGGILRAAMVNLTNLGVEQGGSTITQQYVKNALLSAERSFSRKITEATWAVRLEQRMEKSEILERYLNLVYLGDGNYGVAAAAEYWFGTDVADLDLSQSALLAAMIRAPETLDPVTNPERAGRARDRVIDRLEDLGWIEPEEAAAARSVILANQVDVTPLPSPAKPMFVDTVTRTLLDDERLAPTRQERIDLVFGGGLQITTTLRPVAQQAAEDVIAGAVADPAADPLVGIVSVEPGDGAVRAMALGPKAFGACDDAEGCVTTQVNPLVPGMGSPGRQVGSAIKPIVVAAALEAGLPADWHTDASSGREVPGCDGYAPENYDGADPGTIDLVEALRTSNNAFHVKLGLAAGLEGVVDLAARLGLEDLPPWCSISLGSVEQHPVEMAAAYAAFAADGRWCSPYVVSEVRDATGEVLLQAEPSCEQVVSAETAAAITTLLHHNANQGTAKRALVDRPIAAKTGTTNDFLDAWLVGYTPQLATAVWIGYEDPAPLRGIFGVDRVSGGSIPAQLWGAFTARALAGVEVVPFDLVELPRWSCGEGDADSFLVGDQSCGKASDDKDHKGKGGKRKGGRKKD